MKIAASIMLPVLLLAAVLALPLVAQDAEQPPMSEEERAALQKKYEELVGLQRQAHTAFKEKDYEAAIGFYEKALELAKDEKLDAALTRAGRRALPSVAYNMACTYGLWGKQEKTLEWLEKAIEYGFRDAKHIKMDTDLESVKGTARYKALVDGLLWNDKVTVIVPDGVEPTTPLPVLLALHYEKLDDEYVAKYLKDLANEKKVLLVAPRGPFAHPEGGYAWKLDPTDDKPALKKIGMALEAAAKVHPFDPKKVTLLGVGGRAGYMTYLLGLRQPARYQRLVVLGGFFNKYYFPDFFEKAKAENKGIWILSGNKGIAGKALDNCKKASEILTKAGFTVSFTEYDGERRPQGSDLDPVRAAVTW